MEPNNRKAQEHHKSKTEEHENRKIKISIKIPRTFRNMESRSEIKEQSSEKVFSNKQ